MALTKLVNGKRVTLTAGQEAAQLAEWAANEAVPKSIPKSDAQVIREVMIEKGLATAEDFEAKRAG